MQVSGNITTLDVGPANTPTTGGVNDVSGKVKVGGQLTTASVSGNVSGLISETFTINTLYVGGSVTPTGSVLAINVADPAHPITPAGLLGNIATMTVGGSIAGLVQVSGNITTLDVGPANTPTTGDVNDVSGKVIVGGQLTTASVSGNVSGLIFETLTINTLYIGGSVTSSGSVLAINIADPTHPTTTSPTMTLLGNIVTMTVGGSIAGLVQVSGNLTTLDVGPANTPTTGDVNDVSGKVIVGGQLTTASVSGDVSGLISETLTIKSLYIGGSVTHSGSILAINVADPAHPTSPTGLLGNIVTMTVVGSIAGLVQTSGNIATLDVGPANTPTSGDVNDVSGNVLVGGQLTTASVSGNVSGLVSETLTTNSFYIGGSLSRSGIVSAVNSVNAALGNLNSMNIGIDLAGQLIVSGTLRTLVVHGGTPGTVTAGQIGTISVYASYGPLVAQIKEAGIQRRIEAAAPSAPFPTPLGPPAPIPAISPAGIAFKYFYEGLFSPTVEGVSSTNLANPQLTAQVTNASGNTGPDQFDLSLVTYNDAAKFNLARLDANGVAGIRNVDVEGDVLTSVSSQASSFFPGDNTAAGIRLQLDKLAGVGVRDTLPTGFVQAKSIQALAFGSYSYVSSKGTVVAAGASAGGSAAAGLLTSTAIVQANDTFRVPFADLTSVGLYLATAVGGGKFDNSNVVFVVESTLSPNATATGNIATPSNVARGAVTALVNVIAPVVKGKLQASVIQTISLWGDGGSLSTAQYIAQGITSTGPLGDVTQHSSLGITNVTAPSIFGSIIDAWGPITGTVQTTGQGLDPISGQIKSFRPDWGEVYVTIVNKVPTLTVTTVQTSGAGLSGRLISRGNLNSQILASGGVQGLVATQGDIGIIVGGHRLGGIAFSGKFTGAEVTLGSIIGDVSITGGMFGNRIAAKGDIIGNVLVSGGMDASSAIVAGGEIGDATWGTQFTFLGTNYGFIAAKGPIRFAKGNPGGKVFINATGSNADAIDAIFKDNAGQPLSFDNTGLDLGGLAMILENLDALYVNSNGQLV
jgi:hypothetical protein